MDPSLLAPLMPVLASGALFAVLAVLGFAYLQGVRERWRAAADAHGLQFDPGGLLTRMSMRGETRGVAVDVTTVSRGSGKSRRTYTQVKVRVPTPLPDDLHLSRSGFAGKLATALGMQDIPIRDRVLDEKLRVRGRDPAAVQALLDDPRAVSGASVLLTGTAQSRLRQDELLVELRHHGGEALSGTIGATVDAALDLAAAARAPWEAAAQRFGLALHALGSEVTLSGTVDTLPVEVRATGGLRSRTAITIDLQGALPAAVRIEAGDGGAVIGDPILDGRLRIDGPDEAAAVAAIRAGLDDPDTDLRGCLMDVLHGIPGAAITGGRLVIAAEGRLGHALEDRLERALALGAALRAQTPPPDRRRQAAARRERH